MTNEMLNMNTETVKLNIFHCRSRESVSEPGQSEFGCGAEAMKLNL
jgi:hypothetical protein